MKKLFLFLIIPFVFSCSSDEEQQNNNLTATTYISLNTGNFWKYRIENKNGSLPTVVLPQNDHIKVGTDATMNGLTFKKMIAEGVTNGSYSRTLNNNFLRKESDEIKFSGSYTLEIGNGIASQTIPLENFIIFKESATNGTQLSSKEGTLAPIPLTVPVNGTPQSGNLFVTYKVKSFGGETLSSYTPPTPNSGIAETTYTNVKSVKFVVNLKFVFNSSGIDVSLLNPMEQDVIVSTNYYAKDKGVIFTQTNTNFTFISSLNLPPTS